MGNHCPRHYNWSFLDKHDFCELDLHWHKSPGLDERRKKATLTKFAIGQVGAGTLVTLINVDNKLTTVLGVLGNVIRFLNI